MKYWFESKFWKYDLKCLIYSYGLIFSITTFMLIWYAKGNYF